MAVWGAFFVMTAFYLIPIVFIQGLINIEQLRRVHVFAVIIDLPVVSSVVTAILPGATCFGAHHLHTTSIMLVAQLLLNRSRSSALRLNLS